MKSLFCLLALILVQLTTPVESLAYNLYELKDTKKQKELAATELANTQKIFQRTYQSSKIYKKNYCDNNSLRLLKYYKQNGFDISKFRLIYIYGDEYYSTHTNRKTNKSLSNLNSIRNRNAPVVWGFHSFLMYKGYVLDLDSKIPRISKLKPHLKLMFGTEQRIHNAKFISVSGSEVLDQYALNASKMLKKYQSRVLSLQRTLKLNASI